MALAEALADDVDAAFPAFVAEHTDAVYTVALRLCGSAEAEDVSQDAFVRAFTALRRYDPEQVRTLSLRPWVLTIVLNVARNRLRSNGRHPQTALEDGHAQPSHADRTDLRATLAGALSLLPLPARQAVVLRHVVGCSVKETAAILDRPTGTVKAQVARGLALLRTHLEEDT